MPPRRAVPGVSFQAAGLSAESLRKYQTDLSDPTDRTDQSDPRVFGRVSGGLSTSTQVRHEQDAHATSKSCPRRFLSGCRVEGENPLGQTRLARSSLSCVSPGFFGGPFTTLTTRESALRTRRAGFPHRLPWRRGRDLGCEAGGAGNPLRRRRGGHRRCR